MAHLWIITLFVVSLGLFFSPVAEAFLNVFIDQHEMVKLMGLDAELFYVRHGIVNNFALSFVVPVPEQVDDLTFSWQSLVDIPIRYSISIEYESQLGGLLTPHINVPVRGLVPSALSTFTIRLPCAGNVSEEVPVGINLEIDGYPHFNHTKLTFKRNKICLKDETLLDRTSESAVFKLIVFAFTFLLVSSVILVTCYCRGSRRLTNKVEKCHEPSPQTSYTIDESSTCSASSSLSSRCTTTTTTMAKSTVNRPATAAGTFFGQRRCGGGDYGNVPGCHRSPSIASCSSIYETIVESVNKFPMQTMHSNKTCGACCSLFGGEQTLYDGVTIAGLVLPKDRRSVTGGPGPVPGAIYDQPNEMEATIRWPAPPLFSLEDEQRQQQQRGQSNKAATLMGRVKHQNSHCGGSTNNIHNNNKNNGHETRSTPGVGGGVGGFEGNPFVGTGLLWNADAATRIPFDTGMNGVENNDAAKDSSAYYYEPFGNQHL